MIAFVCTGNTCRSPMAEAIFNKIAEEKDLPVRAVSFGLAAVKGMPASKQSVAVCQEIGIDLIRIRILSSIMISPILKKSTACRMSTVRS